MLVLGSVPPLGMILVSHYEWKRGPLFQLGYDKHSHFCIPKLVGVLQMRKDPNGFSFMGNNWKLVSSVISCNFLSVSEVGPSFLCISCNDRLITSFGYLSLRAMHECQSRSCPLKEWNTSVYKHWKLLILAFHQNCTLVSMKLLSVKRNKVV